MGEVAGLFYEEHGPADGPPLILSAGLGGSGAYWQPNIDALARDHRVIVYDHRGTGRSDRHLSPEMIEGMLEEHMADDVISILDHLGIERATLVGHALGAIVGCTLALLAPERLAGLVIVNGFAKPDGHFFNCMDTRRALLRDSGVIDFVRAQPLFLYPARWIVENFDRIAAQENELCTGFQGKRNLDARINMLCAWEIDTRLDEIRTPTLVVGAEDDMLVAASHAEALAAGIPGARLVMMKGGHACNVTEPEAFNAALLDWLAAQHGAS